MCSFSIIIQGEKDYKRFLQLSFRPGLIYNMVLKLCSKREVNLVKKFLKENRRYLELLIMTLVIIASFVALFTKSDALGKALTRLVGVLMPFIVGFVIAYLLQPIVIVFEKYIKIIAHKLFGKEIRSCRAAAIGLSIIVMFYVFGLLLDAVIPGLVDSIKMLITQAPASIREFELWLENMLGREPDNELIVALYDAIDNAYQNIYQTLQSYLLPNLENIVSGVSAGFSGMVGVFKNVIIGLIVSIYLLASWDKFGAQAKIMLYALVPEKAADWICEELKLTDQLFGGFISGKIIDSTIIGILCFIFCFLVKMPYALLVSVIVGVTNIIPFFGPYFGAIPSAILILTESPTKCIVFVVFIILLQQLDGNVIGPKILGDKIGISSFWILFAILFFGSYWGVVGMLVGVPLFALIYDLVKRIVSDGLKEHGKTEMMDAYIREYKTEPEPEKKTSGKKGA